MREETEDKVPAEDRKTEAEKFKAKSAAKSKKFCLQLNNDSHS